MTERTGALSFFMVMRAEPPSLTTRTSSPSPAWTKSMAIKGIPCNICQPVYLDTWCNLNKEGCHS